MTKPKLRKSADISPPQSPHDGIHTCSRGCSKPGCTRTLRDTIEEQDQQIEALKRDILEKTAELRKSEEHNAALCERMQDLNGEVHTASCANANMHKHKEENARLKTEVEHFKFTLEEERQIAREDWAGLRHENARLKAEVERLTALFTQVESCRYNITCCKRHPDDSWGIPNDWRADSFNLHLKTLKEVIEKAKGVQS
jgi:uncharacterized coiled-coil protein SlyX